MLLCDYSSQCIHICFFAHKSISAHTHGSHKQCSVSVLISMALHLNLHVFSCQCVYFFLWIYTKIPE